MSRPAIHGPGWEAERLYHDWRDRMASKPLGRLLVWLLIAAGWGLLATMGSCMWLVTHSREAWYRCRKTPATQRAGYLPIRRYDV